MKAELTQHRKPGRPATQKDKNGRPMSVRADRDQPVQCFFESVPRAKLEEALEGSGDQRLLRLYDALQDPAYRNTNFSTLCRRFGVSLKDLVKLWRDYNVALGMLLVGNLLPEIMKQTAEDALSREVACSGCDGSGNVTNEEGQRTCPVCQGAGRIRVPGDKDARRLVFEIAGLMGRNRVPVVAIQQNFGLNLEDNVKEIDKILMEQDP